MRNTKHVVNGHFVLVPEDMEVTYETGFPGAYDHIDYKGFQLTTFDTDEQGVYAGPFVFADDPTTEFDSLDEARRYIDGKVTEEV